ncbi:YceD family protein [Limimaricola sp.]|uniref:YceD family protein n=1 Tax=Limimaricola sp. TaxID=2211665 RepID=UPI0040593A32
MADATPLPRRVIRLGELSERRGTEAVIETDASARAAVAAALGIRGIRKLRFAARLTPEGSRGWRLDGDLGATVVQDCVVTLDPVVTRIDETVLRRYLADVTKPDEAEAEMPEDDTIEPLPTAVDLAQVMIEALALALPDYPRAEGVGPADMSAAAPGAEPITDEDVKPFAGLKGLRDKLSGGENDDA